MPYYVFRISDSAGGFVKQLDLLDTYEKFRDAKVFAKEQRKDMKSDDTSIIKVMFAENQLSAEEQLQEKREQPIVMEWEK
jgi:hypothetical protein